MLTKNKFSFPLILFFSIYLFFCLNWNFVESKNLESRKPEISKIKKILTKRGRKFNFNKTDKLTSRKLNGEFFVDFALVGYYEDIEFSGYEILYYLDFCYDEEKYFQNYCDLDKMSKPINATFDVSQATFGVGIRGAIRVSLMLGGLGFNFSVTRFGGGTLNFFMRYTPSL
ncbi:unnamed protein product [Meloidogyne enterolobii]|uniref:Uncharacterized protein n=1 Tax=Meloidogyne enterolobii TaxID=390850 RepID=A0ACB0XQ52_MELEN